MSRSLTANFKAGITAGTTRPAILTEMLFDSGAVRFHNGIGDLTYDGDVYSGAGTLLKIEPIQERKKTEALGTRLALSGVPQSIVSLALSEHYEDRPMTIILVLFDDVGNIITDPYVMFSGKMDIMEIEEGGESSIITLNVENDLIALKRPSERRRTPEDQKIKYPDDTFFKDVAALQSKDVRWGS